MNGLACPRCLNGGVLFDVEGKAYPCPGCAPPHLRKAAIDLDVKNQIRLLEAIDANYNEVEG